MSVLNWTGSTKPGTLALGLLTKGKDTMSSYRGRLVMLESTGNLGANAGLIQITGGPDHTKFNQRVFFSSEQVSLILTI